MTDRNRIGRTTPLGRGLARFALVASSLGIASGSLADGQLTAWGRIVGDGATLMPQAPSLLGVQSAACSSLTGRTAMVMSDGSLRIFPDADAPYVLQAPGSCRAVFGGFQGRFAVLQPDGAFRIVWGSSWATDDAYRFFEGRQSVMAALTQRGMMVLRSDGVVEQDCLFSGSEDCGPESVPEDLGLCRWISAGNAHLLAVTIDGSVRAWGDNTFGQVDGPAPDADCVARPADLGPCSRVAGGYSFTLALQQDGQVRAWGDNFARNYEEGNGQCDVPADLGVATEIAAGTLHSVALLSDGSVRAWGSNLNAQCDGPPEGGGVVRQKPSDLGATTHIAAGDQMTVAVLSDGGIAAWGANFWGECDTPRSTGRFTQVSAGGEYVMGVRADGSIEGWGRNDWGQVGGPDSQGVRGRPEPLPPCSMVSAGEQHTVALRQDGAVVAWGDNRFGQCDVPEDLGVCTRVAASQTMSYAIRADGQVRRWGTRFDVFDEVFMPEDLGPCVRIAANSDHVLVIEADGSVNGWGKNNVYQVQGTPPADWFDVYGRPADLGPCSEVSVGTFHSLALRTDGQVRSWGWNIYGECDVPADLPLATAIAAGGSTSVALRPDGRVCAWGYYDQFAEAQPPTAGSFVALTARWGGHYAIASAESSDCEGPGAAATATPRINGSPWSEMSAWSWSDGGISVPGSSSAVNLAPFGSIGSDCAALAGSLVAGSGSTLYLPVRLATGAPPEADSITVMQQATLAGTLSLQVRGESGVIPADMEPIPVLSAGSIDGGFELLLSNVAPPPGKFLTVGPAEGTNGTVLVLRLMDLPNGAQLNSGAATGFSGQAIAAAAMDLDRDGFDDLALAISFGPGSPGLVQVLLNDGTGTLGGASVLRITPPEPTCIAAGDVDGDGFSDLAAGFGPDALVRVYRNATGANLDVLQNIQLASEPTAIGIIPPPFQGTNLMPGSSSVAVGTKAQNVRIFNGVTGAFLQNVSVAGVPGTVRGGNTGGAGGQDIVTGGSKSASVGLAPLETGFVDVLRTDGSNYAVEQSVGLTGRPLHLDVGDIDGDGLDDVVTANADPVAGAPGASVPVLSILRNRDGQFGGPIGLAPTGASAGIDVALVDADGDGDRDIVSVQRTLGTASEAVLIRVDSLGADSPLSLGQPLNLSSQSPTLVARGNLDGQGGQDVFLVGGVGNALTGDGSATPFLGIAEGKFGDLDGNGTVDNGDVALALLDFGPCPGCTSDVDQNGEVDFGDIALILLSFG
jgi:alpha-tubulin suppressor-like RCC1 family protein